MTSTSQQAISRKGRKKAATLRSSTPPFVLRMMATCFVNADRLSEAERLLQNPAWGQDGDMLRYELGIAYAAQGKLDGALSQFNTILQRQPNHDKARQALLDILRLQASQQIAQQQWEDAANTLGRAWEISPDDELLLRTLSEVQEVLPIQFLVQHQRDQAVRVWERVQAASPTNIQIAHRLAILQHRWAIELEQQGQIQAADLRWRKAMANWAMLAATDTFWPMWKAKREGVYGVTIEQEDIEKLRHTGLRNRLEQVHRDFQTAYSEAKDPKNSERHAEYRLLLKLELKTAEALKETIALLRKHNQPIKVPLCAGPLLLTQLGLLAGAKQMATAAQQLASQVEAPKTLATYLSPLGRIALLVEERQTERALPELRQIVKQEPTNSAARRLLVLSLKEAGSGVVTNDVDQALNFWGEAIEYDPNHTELKELIAQTCIEQATKQRGSEPDKVITLLERGVRYAPDHRSLKENLAACLNQRGVRYANDKQDWDRALADLQRAVQLDPSNQTARENLQKVREAKEMAPLAVAVEHLNGQRYDAAITVLRQVLQANPNHSQAKQMMGVACNEEGVRLANKAAAKLQEHDRLSACSRLNEAENILTLGLRYAPNHQRLSSNLEQVRQLQRQLGCSIKLGWNN